MPATPSPRRAAKPPAGRPAPAVAARQAAASLDRHSAEPLYRQLATRLQREMDRGGLAEGARVPSEAALMARFGVSRVTVRQATALLQKHGKLVAQRGKGTFVATRVVQHDLDALQGFYDSLRQQGIEPQTQLLEFSPDAGALDEQRPAGTDLPVRLSRLYSVDGRPFALVVGYLPRSAAGLGRARAERLTVYQILREYLGIAVSRAEVIIRCQKPPRPMAKLLGLKPSDSVLVMERQSFAEQGGACEFMRIFIVPERYEFRLKVTGALEIARFVQRVSNPSAVAPSQE